MACLNDLPVEVLEKILQLLAGDPVSVRRAWLVCHQWADIVHNLLLRGRITCNPKVNDLGSESLLPKVLRRLTTTESFNEAFTIVEQSRPHAFKEGSLLAARAEKVFSSSSQLFSIPSRCSSPTWKSSEWSIPILFTDFTKKQLQAPGDSANDKIVWCYQAISFSYWNDQITIAPTRQPVFQLDMVVDRSILLLGMAVFLPHGENIQGDVNIFVGASVKVCEETSREKVSLPNKVFLLR